MTDIEIPLGKRTAKYRFFEMLPALLSYGFILLPIVLSIFNSLYASIFIVAFITWWFVKAIGIAYRTLEGFRALDAAQKVNWHQRLRDLEAPERAVAAYAQRPSKQWHAHEHFQNLVRMQQLPEEYLHPKQVINAVIVPFYKEPQEVLEPTIKAILASNYAVKTNLILILGPEQRAPGASELAEKMVAKYKEKCLFMTAVTHPTGLPNEQLGKGGNITFSGRFLQQYLEKKGISPERVVVTTFDADNRAHPEYFACVSYEYIVDPKRNHRSFQPITLYLNNIWDAPAPMRVLATGNSFWTIINSVRPHMLRNFSSHSQGMAALIATDFWSVRTIVEDGHQYWRSYFAFDGDYEVTPIYIPVFQDAVLETTYIRTLKAQFIQLRRWAYGASDVAYVADKGFRKGRTVPLWGLIARFCRLVESHVSWATASIIITVGAWVPLVVNIESSRSILAHELPQIASQLQTVAVVGLFMTIFLTFKLLPPRPPRYRRRRNLLMLVQWLLMPITSICYGSAAAITAQTHLLLGKYLDKFDITTKAVKK